MLNRRPTFVILSCSLFSLFSISGWAADLYVSPSGSDSNAGTSSSAPLKTISKASALAKAGTTVHVAAGTYNVSAPSLSNYGIVSSTSGTASAHIIYSSNPKNRAKIVMSGTGGAWHVTGSYVDIDGFEITGSGRLGILAEGAHLNITSNYIHDLTVSGGCNGSGGGAIDTPGTTGDIVISDNIVRNIGYALIGTCNTVQGIYIASPANVVMNNVVSGVAAVGIQQWHGATSSSIINNTVFHCSEGILIGDGDGGALPGGSANNYVANNIVYDNSKVGIYEYGSIGANNRYINNLVYKSATSVKMIKGSVSGTISQDPLFVKYEADGSGDYHLEPSSPAIGKGTLTGAPTVDIDGNARGSSIDIGAYEYMASVASAPAVGLSATSLSFGSVHVGTISAVKTLTIKNTGTANLSFTSGFVFSSGFSGSGNCYTTTPLAPGASCNVNLKFTPTTTGAKYGTMTITTNAPSSPNIVKLSGTGY